MRLRSVLFKKELLRKVMSGEKTVTRRLLKCNRCEDLKKVKWLGYEGSWLAYDGNNKEISPFFKGLPAYMVGDVLICREAWRTERFYDGSSPRNIKIDDGPVFVWYELDGETCLIGPDGREDRNDLGLVPGFTGRVRSSLHMPYWAARTRLKIISLNIERLSKITEEDAIKEGVSLGDHLTYRDAFISLWNEINGHRKCANTEDDPWVWRIEFERLQDDGK